MKWYLRVLFIGCIFISNNIYTLAQYYAPSDYFPLEVSNHWEYDTVFDTLNPNNDRWSFIDVVDTITFGIPDETFSYKVEYSECLYHNTDTSLYQTEFLTYTASGDLGVTAYLINDSLIVLDSLAVFIRNPITVGDSIINGFDDWQNLTVIISVSDTLTVPGLGYFENCLHIFERLWLNGQIREESDRLYIPVSYLPDAVGMGKRSGVHWYSYPDSSRFGYSYLSEFNQTVGIEDKDVIPSYFSLSQNYPNPFNPTTTISFTIEHPQFVTLKVYDLLGREIRTLIDEDRQAGLHNVAFDASDLSSGIYFYRLQAGDISESKRMVLLK